MQDVPFHRQLVSVPLITLVNDLLGSNEWVSISPEIAEILILVTGNKNVCHVQLPSDENLDIFGEPITTPRLWSLAGWSSSQERWQRQRVVAEKEREQRHVFDANVHRLAKAILKLCPLNPDQARVIAYSIVKDKDWDKAKAIGLKNIAETMDDL